MKLYFWAKAASGKQGPKVSQKASFGGLSKSLAYSCVLFFLNMKLLMVF